MNKLYGRFLLEQFSLSVMAPWLWRLTHRIRSLALGH
jgi:hypothetical protein